MAELWRRLSGRVSSSEVARRVDGRPQFDQDQQVILSDLLARITNQAELAMNRRNRTTLVGRTTTIYRPLLTPQGELSKLTTERFTVNDGTTLHWHGAPTAVALGQVEGENTPLLIGGAHYSDALRYNGIDIRRPDRFTAMFGEFPGHFLSPVDYLSFVATFTPNGDLGVIVGDMDSSTRTGLLEPVGTLRSLSFRKVALDRITGFVDDSISRKFLR